MSVWVARTHCDDCLLEDHIDLRGMTLTGDLNDSAPGPYVSVHYTPEHALLAYHFARVEMVCLGIPGGDLVVILVIQNVTTLFVALIHF